MRKNKAFTLIEVMVVLSILALIAILAYNYFGSTMKEAKLKHAATKLLSDMQTLEQAYLLYEAQTGTSPPTGFAPVKTAILDSGILKAWPTPDLSWKGADAGEDPDYRAYNNYDDFPTGAGATNDAAIIARKLTKEVCLKAQELYTDLGGTQAWDYNQANAEPTPYPDKGFWCETWDSDATDDYYLILKIRNEDD